MKNPGRAATMSRDGDREQVGPEATESERRGSEARLRSILETAPDSIMMVDRAGKILFINRARAPLLTAEVAGRSCYDFVPAESHHRVAAALERVFTRSTFDEYEVRSAPTPDGEWRWYAVRAGPMIEGGR